MLRYETLMRLRWLPLAVMLLTAPLVTVGVVRLETDSSGFVQWLPDDQQDKQEYLEFVELFGGDDYVLATWPGAGLNDSRLDNVTAGLREADARRAAAGEPPLIDHINSGSSVYRELTSDPLNLSSEEAIQRLQGILIGPDGETTGVIIQTTPAGKTRQQDVIAMVRQVAADAGGVDAEELRLGGTIFEAVSIEQATERSLRNFALPILLITLVLTYWCFRSVPLTLIVLGCAVYCRCVSLSLVYFTGNALSAVLVVMPVLIYVLTISGAVHLVNYYRDALRSGTGRRAPLEALKAGWLPCSMAAATTSIGLTSLAVSGIGPVRDFGVYSGISLMIAITFLLAFLPAALTFLRSGQQAAADQPGTDQPKSATEDVAASGSGTRDFEADEAPTAGGHEPPVMPADSLLAELGGFSDEEIAATADPHRAPWHERMSVLVLDWHQVIISVGILLVVVLGMGLMQTETTVELDRMFSPESEILRNYNWIERHFGPLVPVEATITFPADHPADMLTRLELVDAAEQLMRKTDEINGTMSAATFVPPVPSATGFQSAVSRRIFGIRVEKQRDRMIAERFLASAGEQEVWRITARVPTFTEVDYSQFRVELQQQIGSLIDQRDLPRPEEIRVGITGLLPLIDTAQRQLLDDLVESFLLAVLLICPVMMFVLRGVLAGLVAMLPNVVPVIVIFGGMGWLGLRIDVGAVLTASVALGIAVDDTLHVLTWYARAIRQGLDRTSAIQVAYSRCTVAMTQTTIICGLGLLVLTLSSFVPTAQFAWLILVLLTAALVGDLILLPALLVGPAGQLMIRGLLRKSSDPEPAVATDPAIGSGK